MTDRGGAGRAALGWRAWAGGLLLRLVLFALAATWRLTKVTGGEHMERLRADGRPAIYAFWHDRIFYLGHFLQRRLARRGVGVTVLISRSRDGDFGDALTRLLGAKVVRGSTSRGGSSALRSLIKELRRRRSVVIVVDGPKGPHRQPKPGALMLARTSGAPVVPITWKADRAWRLGTWDATEIPKPFSRIEVHVGEPMELPRDLDEEAMAQALAHLANALGEH